MSLNETLRLHWNETFAVGHDELDADHRRLIEAINQLCTTVEDDHGSEQLRAQMEAFKLLAEDHFKRENAVLRNISGGVKDDEPERRHKRAHLKVMSDAALEKHIAEHGRAFARLERILALHSNGTASAAATLCADLTDWFIKHAVKYDAHLKTIFQAM